MAENKLSTSLSGMKNTFNLLKEWQESEEAEKSYFHQANSILKENDDEIMKMKWKNSEDRGKNVSRAGASGIDVSSFNDVLLAKDLKSRREIYERQTQAKEKAKKDMKRSQKEIEKRQKKAFSYSVGLLSDLSCLGF